MEDFNDNMNYDYNRQDNESYSNPYNQFYDIKKNDKPLWAAIVSFVLSIINVVSCCCCGYLTIIISLVLGIISLAKKWGGKGFAIAGVAISSVSLVVIILSQVFLGGLSMCFTDVMSTTPQYYEEYKETGEIPEALEKYNNDEYDWYWKMTGHDSFAEFYNSWMTIYGGMNPETDTSEPFDDWESHIDDDDFYNFDDFYGDESSEPEFGEIPVEL